MPSPTISWSAIGSGLRPRPHRATKTDPAIATLSISRQFPRPAQCRNSPISGQTRIFHTLLREGRLLSAIGRLAAICGGKASAPARSWTMDLPLGQKVRHRVAEGVDQGVDLVMYGDLCQGGERGYSAGC